MIKQLQDTSIKVLIMVALALIVQMTPASVFAQSSVKGTVTSSDDGSNLPGVSIVVKGTHRSEPLPTRMEILRAADFSITNAVLVFSFIGFMTKEVRGRQSNINQRWP